MSDFVITADSACDLPGEVLSNWKVRTRALTFNFIGDNREYHDTEMDSSDFYNRMRNGDTAKTAGVNVEDFLSLFREVAAEGKDVLYIGFSSGLSTTYNSARLAANQIKDEFPDRKFRVVDSLSASVGFGLLLRLAVLKKESGASLEETCEYVEEQKLHICHWFTVDDLVYLKRGGRISPTAAFVGNMLGIKPVLHMDNEGHLVPVTKVRGRKASIKALADKFGELAVDKTSGPLFACHGDCMEDVETLRGFLKRDYGVDLELVSYTGTVIGAHSGPGTLSLFFVGRER